MTRGSIDLAPESSRGALRGKRVLVVDDDDDARDLLETLLSLEGALVSSASSAEEALDQISSALPDVLLSDIGMPQYDGYWLVERVRERWPELPAVALTAFARPEDAKRAAAAGFDRHVGKPVEPGRLVSILASCERTPR